MDDTGPRKALASWLGLLLLLVFGLVVVGGYVRLTGSGLAMPGWPMPLGHLLPPMGEAEWQANYVAYVAEIDRFEAKSEAGKPGIGRLYRPVGATEAERLADFKRIYLIEWSHRALAGLTILMAFACALAFIRDRGARRLAARPLTLVIGLLLAQSVIGGVLVLTGTSTHWLFVHLGMASLVICCLIAAILALLRGDSEQPSPAALTARAPARRLALLAFIVIFMQILLGALVAGSRHNGFATDWPRMEGSWLPRFFWDDQQTLTWNLLDNPWLHQWVHRWFAWLAAGIALVAAGIALRSPIGPRGRLAALALLSTIVAQMGLGVLNVLTGAHVFIPLAHLVLGELILAVSLILVLDLRREPQAVTAPGLPQGLPA